MSTDSIHTSALNSLPELSDEALPHPIKLDVIHPNLTLARYTKSCYNYYSSKGNRKEGKNMKKRQVWAVADWGKIIKSGFSSSAEAYKWLVIHGVDAAVVRVWI